MILVKFVFWSFYFFSETEAGPIRTSLRLEAMAWQGSAFRSLWFRDPPSLRRKFISVNQRLKICGLEFRVHAVRTG
jgi:hypothetical protein